MTETTVPGCEFGVEGSIPQSAQLNGDEICNDYLQRCFREPGAVWGRSDAELPAFIAGVRELGATFFVLSAIPQASTRQARQLQWIGSDGSAQGLRRFAAVCRDAGLKFFLNTQVTSYSKPGDFLDKLGHDIIARPNGTYCWELTGRDLECAAELDVFQGVLYDEPEWETVRNERNCHGGCEGPGISTDRIHPLFARTEGLGVMEAYEAVWRGAKEIADRNRQRGLATLTEHVFPVMFHTFARAGMNACPKFLKEGLDPIWAAIALGAAKQYGTELWVAPDLWGLRRFGFDDKVGFPGHSPEELRCSLLYAYWLGATGIFVENIYADFIEGKGARPTGLLDRVVGADGTVRYVPSAYGRVYPWFVRDYVAKHPRPYTFRDVRPDVVIVRFDDTYWGQNHSSLPRHLYGGADVGERASEAWIDIWHLLTHGQTSRQGISYYSGGWERRPHDFFCALRNVVVYDHRVGAEHLEDVGLIFLTGIAVSEETRRAVAAAVRSGAVCIAAPHLAPASLSPGKGRWIVTDDFLSPEVRRAVAPFLGRPDEISYRFSDPASHDGAAAGAQERRFTSCP